MSGTNGSSGFGSVSNEHIDKRTKREKEKITLYFSSTVEPRYFKVPREMEKQFEIVGFRNNRGSAKFVTMNHFFMKCSTV